MGYGVIGSAVIVILIVKFFKSSWHDYRFRYFVYGSFVIWLFNDFLLGELFWLLVGVSLNNDRDVGRSDATSVPRKRLKPIRP